MPLRHPKRQARSEALRATQGKVSLGSEKGREERALTHLNYPPGRTRGRGEKPTEHFARAVAMLL
jgi:hypothetical protein